MSAGMNLEEAKIVADKMTYADAVCNALASRCVPYRKATKIKLKELLEIAKSFDKAKKMSELLQRIANYFAYQYKGNDKVAPKMDMSVDDLRNIAALHVEKCKLEEELRNLRRIKTNADRIRNMSDEELAKWINTKDACEQCAYEPESLCMKETCANGILQWLQSEAE